MMKFAVQAVALGVATFASTLTMAEEKTSISRYDHRQYQCCV